MVNRKNNVGIFHAGLIIFNAASREFQKNDRIYGKIIRG